MAFREIVVFAVLSVMPEVQNVAPVQAVKLIDPAPTSEVAIEPLAAIPPPVLEPASEKEADHPICRVGALVMVPDGREGHVTSREDGICRVMAYGEGYVSLWLEDSIEPVYPQEFEHHTFGH